MVGNFTYFRVIHQNVVNVSVILVFEKKQMKDG